MKQAILILVTAGAALFFKKDHTAEAVLTAKDATLTCHTNIAAGKQYAGALNKSTGKQSKTSLASRERVYTQ